MFRLPLPVWGAVGLMAAGASGFGVWTLVSDSGNDKAPVRVLGESFANPSTSGDTSGGSSIGSSKPAPGGNNAGGNGQDKKNVTVTGGVTGLYPGATRPLVLTFTNPNSQKVTITQFTVTASDVSTNCRGSLVTASGFSPFSIERNATATETLQVTLASTATNACRDKTWTLTYSGTAAQA